MESKESIWDRILRELAKIPADSSMWDNLDEFEEDIKKIAEDKKKANNG